MACEHARTDEYHDAGEEEQFASPDVGEATEVDQQRRKDQRIDGVDPLRIGESHIQIFDHARQSNVHYRAIHNDHGNAKRKQR